jgi:hypothetical protein
MKQIYQKTNLKDGKICKTILPIPPNMKGYKILYKLVPSIKIIHKKQKLKNYLKIKKLMKNNRF